MRRVLLTSHKFFPQHRAGTEVLTLKIAQALQSRGHQIKVVAANPPDLDARRKFEGTAASERVSEYQYEGLDVHICEEPLRLDQYDFSCEYYHPQMKKHFLGLLDQFKPDIVLIVHAQNLSASIVEACVERGIPAVAYTTDFWFVCPIVQLTRPDGEVCRGPGPGAVKCLSCYTPKLLPQKAEFIEAVNKKYVPAGRAIASLPAPLRDAAQGGLHKLYNASKWEAAARATTERPDLLRRMANKLDKILVPTGLMRDIFVENGIDSQLLSICHYGIDTSKLTPYQEKVPSDLLRIGYVGTFYEHKGVDLLISAYNSFSAEMCSRTVVKLYGDESQFPEYSAKLRDLARAAGEFQNNIIFGGTFPNDQLGPILQEIDVLVVPSRWYENTPLVMQSALATRTPLIVTDLGGMSELVKHGENGLLFKLNDYRSLAAQIASLLADPALLKGLAAKIKSERTVPEMVDDIESVFDKVLERPRAALPRGE